jgi:CubicO group peptidase (beta-lactamase class C family)
MSSSSDLDAPVDRYLKRWHLPTSGPDPSGVTLRRLLSHTAGLARGPVTFNHPRRPSPTLERIFSGEVLFGEPVHFIQDPGAGHSYSNAGYVLVQMLIEDVTGEPFPDYMQREVLDPLGMRHSHFGWTPELQAAAPRPYGVHGEPLPFLRVIELSAGGLMGPVPEYARFLAAAMPGPHGEPPGRGVLKPETVSLMLAPQPGTDGQAGLGYALDSIVDGPPIFMHRSTCTPGRAPGSPPPCSYGPAWAWPRRSCRRGPLPLLRVKGPPRRNTDLGRLRSAQAAACIRWTTLHRARGQHLPPRWDSHGRSGAEDARPVGGLRSRGGSFGIPERCARRT